MNKETEISKRAANDIINDHYQKISEAISESERRTRNTFKKLCETQRQVLLISNVLICFILRNNLMLCMRNSLTAN